MTPFAENLRNRAKALNLSHAEVARRAGLSERRFGNYAIGRREPDLATLARIASVLRLSVDAMLRDAPMVDSSTEDLLRDRLISASAVLTTSDLEMLVIQVEALAKRRAAQKGDAQSR